MTSKTAQTSHQTIAQTILEVLSFLLFAITQCVISIVKNLTPYSFRTKKDIEGDIALITGAGSGIGRLTALRLARLKAKVVVWDVNEEGVEETVKLIKANGGFAKGYKVDLCKREDVYKIAQQTIDEVGEVSILINNAGVVSGKNLLETPDHLIQRTFDVNAISHFWTTKAFLPAMMRKNRGHIVTIASVAGHFGTAKLVDYCASKFAAVGFDESLKLELDCGGYFGIYTSCICPYFIKSTGMFDNANARLIPRLNSNDVADHIVSAIQYNRRMVTIPSHLGLGMVLKYIVPWKLYSMASRLLVPDAAPEQNSNKPTLPSFEPSVVPIKKGTDMTIKHRVLPTDNTEGERLP